MTHPATWLTSAVLIGLGLCSSASWAATEEDVAAAPSEGAVGTTGGADLKETNPEGGEATRVKTLDPGEIERAQKAELANSPYERPKQQYYFVGLRYRGVVIPRFYMSLFGDGGTSVWVNGVGPEFTIRKDRFEYVFSLWWGDYSMKPTPFKAFTDPEKSWEIVESKLQALHLTTDFNWTSEISPVVGVNFGVGAGFLVIWGDLLRTQAYPRNGRQSGNPDDYLPCSGPNQSSRDDPQDYCSNSPDHYGYKEPSWASGGSKPLFFPWLSLQTGLRIKPHKNFMMRIEGGVSDLGFFVGAAGNYGI